MSERYPPTPKTSRGAIPQTGASLPHPAPLHDTTPIPVVTHCEQCAVHADNVEARLARVEDLLARRETEHHYETRSPVLLYLTGVIDTLKEERSALRRQLEDLDPSTLTKRERQLAEALLAWRSECGTGPAGGQVRMQISKILNDVLGEGTAPKGVFDGEEADHG